MRLAMIIILSQCQAPCGHDGGRREGVCVWGGGGEGASGGERGGSGREEGGDKA